ncbi:thiol reductant ABC exporter subunit CydD [Nocardioides currus]|uniref:ABC transporter permease n=1 Tax=Nocardioides currus TaxID=2133958 RepID=A0A2R7Z2Y7_9ACTN|nr:thiol reductant ABC exporter subunit CydD [Nocardioides currus]PUA83007.1 ABC transporter permease [Nocardioides currus]
MKPLDPALRPHLAPARGALVVATAASIVGGVLLIGQAFAIAALVVGLARGTSVTTAAVATVAVFALRGLTGVVVDLATARAAGSVSTALRGRVLRASLGSQRRTGEVAVLLTRGLAATEPWFTRYLPALVVAAVVPLLTVATIAWLDPWSGLVVALTVPLVPVFAALVGMATRDRAEKQWRLLQSLSGHFLDVVRGLPTLVAHRRATAQVDTIRAVTHRHRIASLATLRLAFASSVVLELLATLSVALVAVCVGLRLAHGSLDFTTALVVLLLAPEAYWPVRRVGAEFHAAAEGAAAFASADVAVAPVPVEAPRLDEVGVVLDDVTLGWGEAPVVAGLSARLGIGLTAIVGPSGCGKSTLLAAIAGELTPTSGSVRVAGLSTPEEWRPSVAWLPQRPWLAAGSIASNLRHGDPTATDARLWRALERVDLAHVVLTLPDGLDTELGEDGAGLSAGERARLALARVLVSDRPVVLLDEPTAHLDPVTSDVLERMVGELARSRTVVVVAHRPSLVDLADEVVTLSPLPVAPSARPVVASVPDPVAWEPSRRREVGAVALGALSAAAGVALTATAGWLITRASAQPPVLTLMVAIVGVRAFGLARPVLRYAERLLSHEQALGRLADRRADVYAALVPLVPGRLGAGRRRGDLLTSLVDDVDALVDERVRVRVPLWAAGTVSALALIFAGLVAPAAALVVAVPVLVTALVALLVAHRAAGVERAYVEARALLGERVEATLTDARQLVAWQRDDSAVASVVTASDGLAGLGRRAASTPAIGRALLLLATGCSVALMPSVAGGLAPATAALLVLLPLALHEVLAPVVDAVVARARCRAATARIDELLARTPAVVDPPSPMGWPSTYPTIDVPEACLRLGPGERVGLVGPSGSGKSTIAAQLVRFLDGEVAFDGVPARSLALDDIRAHVALVDDDPYLFATSVVENVRLARPSATDSEVAAALRVAGLGSWELHTLVGAGHREVSGGERARLGLARAVLGRQPVVVLDEPTAHLDAATAAEVTRDVLAALEGRSIVWITHEQVGLSSMDGVVHLGGRAQVGRSQPTTSI